MATTTNYGWVTPDDTALVKDGAAAIRTLGSSADTTTKNLNPETTLGDISFRSSTSDVNTRLGIGTAGQVLTVVGGLPAYATPAGGGYILIQAPTTFSGVSSQSFNNVFTTTYTNYKIILINTSTSVVESTITFRLRASSVDTSANYKCQRIGAIGGTGFESANHTGTDDWFFGAESGTSTVSELTLFRPQTATKTEFIATSMTTYASSTGIQITGGSQTDSTSFDGFTLLLGDVTFGGTVSIYGLAK